MVVVVAAAAVVQLVGFCRFKLISIQNVPQTEVGDFSGVRASTIKKQMLNKLQYTDPGHQTSRLFRAARHCEAEVLMKMRKHLTTV